MFVLQVIQGPYKDQAIQLSRGVAVSVGRSKACTVSFDDPQISGFHAEFTWDDGGFAVRDLGSTNGTLVNGEITKAKIGLRLGDHVQTGGVIFQLKDVDLAEEGLDLIEPAAPTGMLAFDSARTEMVPRGLVQSVLTPAPPTEGTRAKFLATGPMKTTMSRGVASAVVDDAVVSEIADLKQKVMSGAQGAKVVVKRDNRLDPFWALPVTIGREHASGIVLEDRAVSLRHAVVDLRDGRYWVRDVGSSNGVYVNQRRVVEQALEDGDVISVGTHAILVVQGEGCLGLNVQPPQLRERNDTGARSGARLGLIQKPLAEGDDDGGGKRKKKKASDLVWYATSDLDRGVFRGRAALVALVLGIALTGWMLSFGDSEVLAGNQLGAHHEGEAFLTEADTFGRDRCTACHIGAGRIATLKCLDCHPDNRPVDGHVRADVPCNGCHLEHKGGGYKSAAAAALGCKECHGEPHQDLLRLRPKLVAGFSIDAPADLEFHLKHQSEAVACLTCHDPAVHSDARGIRGACGQCHAPDQPAAQDCQLCHGAHPERDKPPYYSAVSPVAPPRFAAAGFVWTLGMLVLSFLLAALVPRKRKVELELPEERV